MDNLQVNFRPRVYRQTVTQVRRHFPYGHGQIKALVGQEVAPSDILGEGYSTAGFRTIYLAKTLGVSPKKAFSCLKRSLQQNIYQGELLASASELFGLKKNNLLSPVDGVLDYYDEQKGELRLKLLPKKIKLVSGVYGVIEEVDNKNTTVIIKTLADLIYGVCGTGQEREGQLMIVSPPEGLISSKQVVKEMEDKIIVGGGTVFPDVLDKMITIGVSGIVAGGIGYHDYKKITGGIVTKHWSDIGMSFLITEGFGFLPMGKDIYNLIKKYEGKYVFLDGNLRKLILPSYDESCMIYIQRTKLPFIAKPGVEPEVKKLEIKAGFWVKIIGAPSMGLLGRVREVDQVATRLPSGIEANLVTVETRLKKVRVPYMNLEIIG